jgi:Ran GTPase-activating protein (RanGAP) involved in mRNA processing and transport
MIAKAFVKSATELSGPFRELVPRVAWASLPEVKISGCKLTTRDVDLLIYFLEANDTLATLSLAADGLDATAAHQLADVIVSRAQIGANPSAATQMALRTKNQSSARPSTPPRPPPAMLQRLDLGWNLIRKQGALAIASVVTCVRVLALAGCGIGAEGCIHLSNALAAQGKARKSDDDTGTAKIVVQELDLSFNDIGAPGAEALANCLGENFSLTGLNLRSNGIGPAGGAALSRGVVRNAGRLKRLCLADNHVGDDIATVRGPQINQNRVCSDSHRMCRAFHDAENIGIVGQHARTAFRVCTSYPQQKMAADNQHSIQVPGDDTGLDANKGASRGRVHEGRVLCSYFLPACVCCSMAERNPKPRTSIFFCPACGWFGIG